MTAFINYFVARWTERLHEEQARNYIANALKILTDNTAATAGAKSATVSHMTKNLSELTMQEKKPEKPQETGQEIAAGIIGRLAKKE